MTTMHLTDDELVLHYYGEMSDAAEARACAHLDECAECRANLQQLQRVMAVIDSVPVPEPDAFFEQRTWANIEGHVRREADARGQDVPAEAGRYGHQVGSYEHQLGSSGHQAGRAEREGHRRLPPFGGRMPWRTMAWGAAAALVVLAAFIAGQFSSQQPAAPVQIAASEDAVGERVLLVDLGDHLDRTETALVEFVSGTDGRELASGRARVEDLVAANRLYRRTAVIAGDQAVADVLDELERVLIEIAGTSSAASIDDLDIMRRRIDTRDLLFKVRVMREQLQERVKEPMNVRTQETTL